MPNPKHDLTVVVKKTWFGHKVGVVANLRDLRLMIDSLDHGETLKIKATLIEAETISG